MPVLLILDTAGSYCSATLVKENEIFMECAHAPMQHGSVILQFCDNLLNKANVTRSQLSAVAFVKGPGSFTGVRIAASISQGIATALGLKVIAIPATHYDPSEKAYKAYQQNYLAPIAKEYWNQQQLINPEEVMPVYLNDIYDE
jgi:tRNA threonylcarbamoyladenosine biosynthesis protein TsaB